MEPVGIYWNDITDGLKSITLSNVSHICYINANDHAK